MPNGFASRGVLIDSDIHIAQIIVLKIRLQLLSRFVREAVIVDVRVHWQEARRQADQPPQSIQNFVRTSVNYRDLSRRLVPGSCRMELAVAIRRDGAADATQPTDGHNPCDLPRTRLDHDAACPENLKERCWLLIRPNGALHGEL